MKTATPLRRPNSQHLQLVKEGSWDKQRAEIAAPDADPEGWNHDPHVPTGGESSQAAESAEASRLAHLERQVASLSARVAELVQISRDARALEDETTEEDPRLDWCEAHLDELARYPRSFAAIHPTLGIVAVSSDSEDFHRQLCELSAGVRRAILLINTAQFV